MMSDEPHEYTPDEIRDMLLDHIWSLIRYWGNPAENLGDTQKRLEGLAFSILSSLDGCSLNLPGFALVPMGYEEDKEYHKEEGESWFPTNEDLEGVNGVVCTMLHEFFHGRRPKG